MSQENVDNVQAGVAAINDAYRTRRHPAWRRHVEKWFDPEVVLEGGSDAFTEGEWLGHDGAVGFVANQMEVLEGMWLRADEFVEVDEDCFLLAITFGGRARHTDIEVELTPVHVFRLRDGKILRWQIFQNREEALEAAGLRE